MLQSSIPSVLEPGPEVPRAHGRLGAAFGRLMLALIGWRVGGAIEAPKAVMIVAPHTSNWDFPIGCFVKLALRLGARFVGKHTLFRGPLGWLMRWLGGIPVDRSAAAGFVGTAAAELRAARRMILVIAPEGTRRRSAWKSGFWRIASEAGVPILPVLFDYRRREVFFAPLFQTTGDYEADLRALRALYVPEMGLIPDNYE